METQLSGAWHLDVTTLASATAAFITWCLYFRFLVVPAILFKLMCFLWPRYVTRGVKNEGKLSIPPGNYGWPLIGETFDFVVDGRKYYRSRIAKHGLIFTSHLITQPFIVVAGPELVRQVLYRGEHLVTSNPPPTCKDLIGEGALNTTEHEHHRFLQRMMRRKFTETSLFEFCPEIQSIVRHHLNKWCQSDTILGVTECKSLTFMVATQVLMGLHLCDEDMAKMQEHFGVFVENFFCFPLDFPGSAFGKTMKARQSMIDIVKRHLAQSGTPDSFLDLIQHAATSRLPGTENIEEKHAESLFIESLFGSYETTSSTLCALVLRLTNNPHVVQRVREEVSQLQASLRVKGDSTENLSYDDLKQLVYVNDVLREVLRLDPPVAGGFRRAVKSFELGGYLVPKDWAIMYCITDTHEQSSLFPKEDRLEFDPDRWSKLRERTGTTEHHFSGDDSTDDGNVQQTAEETDSLHPDRHHYLPFGGGPRHCIGLQYARLFIHILIIELCCNTTWEMQNPRPKIKTAPIPFPVDGMPVRFRHRISAEE